MNSTRIAEVLNFRKSLPPIVTNAHVHALMQSPTAAEKEIKELTTAGVIRRVVVPGRGVGGSSISDALVIVEDWISLVEHSPHLEAEQKGWSPILSDAMTSLTTSRKIYSAFKEQPTSFFDTTMLAFSR